MNFDAGSFRDRTNRVIIAADSIYRVLNKAAFNNWKLLRDSSFYKQCVNDKKIVHTVDANIPLQKFNFSTPEDWYHLLEHEKIPYISYPYEWSFSMLKDAALLQLELLEKSLNYDLIMKDASSYNIQWFGTNPIFIDVASFIKLSPNTPWIGYKQFCELFLFPLMLLSHKDVSYKNILIGNIDGIDVHEMNNIFNHLSDCFKPGVLTHVKLQNYLQKTFNEPSKNINKEMKHAGFTQELITHNINKLTKLINKLKWNRGKSTWSRYETEHNYSDKDLNDKITFVEDITNPGRYNTSWDLGCNTGIFSKIVAKNSSYVIAMDSDQLVIDNLYKNLKQSNIKNILPLVINLTSPSPAIGWRNSERKTLEERGKPDLIVALAVLHHLVISSNVPLQECIEWLKNISNEIIIEFVDRQDSMIKKLLINKEEIYPDYTIKNFESLAKAHFMINKKKILSSGNRVIYHLIKK